jgi:hypothetical protein
VGAVGIETSKQSIFIPHFSPNSVLCLLSPLSATFEAWMLTFWGHKPGCVCVCVCVCVLVASGNLPST